MKRTFKTLFCVVTLCAMVAFYGCGKKDDGGGAKSGDKGGSSTSTDTGKEGSDKK